MLSRPELPRRLATAAGALATGAPPLLAIWYILTYGVNAAHWDHLIGAELFERYYTGTLTLEYLFRPHLEHMKVFPRLMALGLGLLSRFDNVVEMCVQWVLLCATAALLFAALQRRLALSAARLLVLFPPITFALFNLRQHESLLVGDGMITYVSMASIAAALCVLDRARSAAGVLAAAAAGFVASFSHASALLVWPIGLLVILAPGATARAAGLRIALPLWLGVAALVTALYAWRLPQEAGGAIGYALSHPGATMSYVIAASGVPFTGAPGRQWYAGAAALSLELVTIGLVLARGRRRGPIAFGVFFVLFALGCRVLMAAGRVHALGPEPLPSRYAALVGLAAAGAFAAALEIRHAGRAGRLAVALAGVLVAASAFGYREGLRAGPVERDLRLRIGQLLRTTELQRDDTLEMWLYPNAAHAREYARILRERRLNVFADPPLDPSSLVRTAGVELSLDWINGVHVPAGGTFEVGAGDLVQLSGWAFEQRGRRRLAAVYVQFGDELLVPAAYGIHRPDVRDVFPGAPRDTGFGATIPAAALRPGAWPVTLHFVTAGRQRAASPPPLFHLLVR